MTAARKRAAVSKLAQSLPSSSERRRCRVVGLARSSARYRPHKATADAVRLPDIHDLAWGIAVMAVFAIARNVKTTCEGTILSLTRRSMVDACGCSS
ncbi:MAG: hypothetical protein ACJATT_005063 [Myxococcota bacterium]|jgi:hypothetical protein